MEIDLEDGLGIVDHDGGAVARADGPKDKTGWGEFESHVSGCKQD